MNKLKVDLFNVFKKYELQYVAFIGSSYNVDELSNSDSDVDIFVLTNSVEEILLIADEVKKIGVSHEFKVIQCWGIVTKQYLKQNVLHLIIDTIENFKTRSYFLRYSISKYQNWFDCSLDVFRPKNPITKLVLLTDEDGPFHLMNQLKDFNFTHKSYKIINDEIIYSVDKNITYCNKIDMCFYAVFQSIRNTLRWLNMYVEFSDKEILFDIWKRNGLPLPELIRYFIKAKNKYNSNSEEIELNDLFEKSLRFLKELNFMIKQAE